MDKKWALEQAKKVFAIEMDAAEKTMNCLNETFCQILELVVGCKGKVIITGMGKPGYIARKLAATFSSLGTASFMLHPAEAMHGDLGMVDHEDIVIAISYSGASEEIISILHNIKLQCRALIGITGNAESTLAKMCDIVQVLPRFNEACALNLAPTSSTTAALIYGDALAVVASQVYGFDQRDFGMFHPGGALGKKLILKVEDIMSQGDNIPFVDYTADLYEAINEMGKKGLGIVVLCEGKRVRGVITDGDLRRAMLNKVDIYCSKAIDLASLNPCLIEQNMFAVDALKKLRDKNISSCPVHNKEGDLCGVICANQILNAGIML